MKVRTLIPLLFIACALGACKGQGFSKFDSDSNWVSASEHAGEEKSWWDHFWGRKSNSAESEAWKDFYGPADTGPARSEHCGYWGNCAKSGQAPMVAPAPAANCDFYGNCKSAKSGLGW